MAQDYKTIAPLEFWDENLNKYISSRFEESVRDAIEALEDFETIIENEIEAVYENHEVYDEVAPEVLHGFEIVLLETYGDWNAIVKKQISKLENWYKDLMGKSLSKP